MRDKSINFKSYRDISTFKPVREHCCYTWLLSNKLVLNVAKSKFMLCFKHPKVVPTLKLLINGNPIEQVTNFNFLDITIDQNITWSDHITKISIKVVRVVGILSKLKHIFPRNILQTIYNS